MADRHYDYGKRVEYQWLVLFEKTTCYLLDAAAGAAEGGMSRGTRNRDYSVFHLRGVRVGAVQEEVGGKVWRI